MWEFAIVTLVFVGVVIDLTRVIAKTGQTGLHGGRRDDDTNARKDSKHGQSGVLCERFEDR
jgi:hypothetical protein